MNTEAMPASEGTSVGYVRVTYLAKRLESAIRQRLDAMTSGQGLTTPQYAALSILRRTPGLSSAQLARRSFVTAQSMQVMVSAFEREGLLERRPDASHGRILHNHLTRKGLAVLNRSDQGAGLIENQMLAGLDDEEVHALRSYLEICVKNLVASSTDDE